MLELQPLLILIILLALLFDYTNGVHDSANAIAGVVSTRVMKPGTAVIMAAVLNLVGALLSTSVAETVGKGVVHPNLLAGNETVILAALLGAIVWNFLTWHWGLPSSSSHALVGGLVGAALACQGLDSLQMHSILFKVLIPLVLAPLLGFLGGYVMMVVVAWLSYRFPRRGADRVFRILEVISAALMALSHGLNDAQKTMGLIALALFIFGSSPAVHVPLWVRLACATVMMVGTATGGWKIIKTMGNKIFKMEPVHGFASQSAAALVVMAASDAGSPVSTTHVVSSAVLGTGASKRFSAVHWGVARRMVGAWVITIPAAAAVGAVIFWISRLFY